MRALLLLLLVSTLFAADLAFDREALSLTPKPDSEREIITLSFRNAGTRALTITKLDPTCGCISVDLEKRTYQPGEKGELTVIFDLNGLSGLLEKSIQVSYDQGPMIVLHLNVHLAEAPAVTPAFLVWKVGEAATEKKSVITMADDVVERAIEVTSSSPAITGKLSARDDNTYVLAVTPTSTAGATNVMLTVKTDLGRTLRVFASVAP